MTRHTLAQATRIICGDNSGLADPQRWVAQRLRRGTFQGIRINRNWLMTDADIDAAIASLRNDKPKPLPVAPDPVPAPITAGLSARSARRLTA
jgi:hypothetical protein